MTLLRSVAGDTIRSTALMALRGSITECVRSTSQIPTEDQLAASDR
ncbi:hypothetical protein O4214_25800 [Rhodococcus erythropolis]|nr:MULTISPECIES: hypothetical protein [Rhodococcus erythropolis group]MCD2109417.1 hypothetical protein [Rhodococcus qingshengii]MCZ4527408.1 hypothetical protein [Rhodococcus erythropolis]